MLAITTFIAIVIGTVLALLGIAFSTSADEAGARLFGCVLLIIGLIFLVGGLLA